MRPGKITYMSIAAMVVAVGIAQTLFENYATPIKWILD